MGSIIRPGEMSRCYGNAGVKWCPTVSWEKSWRVEIETRANFVSK